jgi:gliding motility-associated lipoprotein GldB
MYICKNNNFLGAISYSLLYLFLFDILPLSERQIKMDAALIRAKKQTMRRIFIFCILTIFLISCNKKNKTGRAVEAIPIDIQVERFDKIFFETPPADLHKVKKQFPFFFPQGNDDSVWLNKMQDPLWRELYTEVQKKYADFEPVHKELETLFKHIKYYFPNTKTPKVITVISEMDYNNKVIYADSLVIISLELYLGKEHKFYQFPNYLKQNFEQKQIMPDIVSSFSTQKIAPVTENNLLSQMIYFGKQMYLKELLLPDYADSDKMGYSSEQIAWCQENESYMWRYFIEKEMLYSDDQKLIPRFINPAPFSKFYLEIDNESPGRVGAWMGWQIVHSYMKNNEVSLQQLLDTNAKEIFEKSKYKPKK